ncbi:dihydropteroate synthase [Hippea alviniae]|uniref:dihydropteroate synthase n=1 Tax=Hippea alviniae TaxID=1279027 RepID=UPI0003B50EB3|nr:dihydropteroate synthase [Hippea alviniae]
MIELLKINEIEKVREELKSIGVDDIAVDLMDRKGVCYAVKVFDCKFYHANILKQEALSVGIDAAVQKDVITAKTQITDCLILGDAKRIEKLAEKLKKQNFEFLRVLAEELENALKNVLNADFVWAFRDKRFDLKDNYLIMGVLNVTPDSFSDGGEFNSVDAALKRTEEMLKEGADIVDVGGESTRPGSEFVSLDEELKRVVPVVEAIKKRFGSDVVLSVDTYKSKVAEEVLSLGADIINDISGLGFDKKLLEVLSKSNCGVVEMHIKGTPKNMQKNPFYEHLISEINSKFREIMDKLRKAGIDEERIVLDPGIGFGKKFEDNLKILNNIESFKIFGRPILIGTSRKSFIGAILNIENPKDRLFGTIASNVVALLKGASIFRVHDVKAHREALKLAKSIMQESF